MFQFWSVWFKKLCFLCRFWLCLKWKQLVHSWHVENIQFTPILLCTFIQKLYLNPLHSITLSSYLTTVCEIALGICNSHKCRKSVGEKIIPKMSIPKSEYRFAQFDPPVAKRSGLLLRLLLAIFHHLRYSITVFKWVMDSALIASLAVVGGLDEEGLELALALHVDLAATLALVAVRLQQVSRVRWRLPKVTNTINVFEIEIDCIQGARPPPFTIQSAIMHAGQSGRNQKALSKC